MRVRAISSAAAALMIFTAGCSTYGDRQREKDFSTEGFISGDCFQVIIKSGPAKGITGLVNQRESAFFAAKKKSKDAVTGSLVQYCIESSLRRQGLQAAAVSNRSGAEQFARTELSRYSGAGTIATEYYLEDNSVILVYRVKEAGMKDRIDSIFIKFEK